MSNDIYKPCQAVGDVQIRDYEIGPESKYEESRAGSYAPLQERTIPRLEHTSEMGAVPQAMENIDPSLTSDAEVQVLHYSSRERPQPSARFQRDFRSHVSVSHKVLLWPEVVRYLKESGARAPAARSVFEIIARMGSPWLLHRKAPRDCSKLPCKNGLTGSTLSTGRVVFPALPIQRVYEYCAAYFNTFNVLCPLLDLDLFMDRVVTRLLQEGYADDDPESVVALLVFALGQLAIEGVTGRPTSASNGESSGFRGGTIETPPGLGLFNEARRRMGMVNTQPCLGNVQAMLLQATFFEASARHLSFWSSTSAASLACTCLIKGQQIDWTSAYGDLVKRAYWVCVLHERFFDLEFCMASTGIEDLEDTVPLPHFHGLVQSGEKSSVPSADSPRMLAADKKTDPAFHFTAIITLSRLMRRADEVVHRCEPILSEAQLLRHGSSIQPNCHASASGSPSHTEAPSKLVEELSRQLDCWRDALPKRLQWSDSDRFDFKTFEPLPQELRNNSFSPLRNLGPGELDHNVDVAIAQLRTRFYHARFLVFRPFIHKAIHSPELMDSGDRVKCAFAIDAACLWPLSLAPPKNKKHLVPHLFSWTQNFVAIILILRIYYRSALLRDICKEFRISRNSIEDTINSMEEWLQDVRQVDGFADWSTRVLGLASRN